MLESFSRRNFLALTGLAGAATVDRAALRHRLVGAILQGAGHQPNSPVVVRGDARFQILSPTVMRLEYVPGGHFIDALSVAVLNRSWPTCPYTARDTNGWVEIETSHVRVKYQLGSGPFTEKNLLVTWHDADGDHRWAPGTVDDKNLGGVGGDWCWRTAPATVAEEPGALSRNGYFWLDDSGTAVWNPSTKWPEPRPHREGAQDWYVFTYGRDFKGLLRELTQLLGPIPMVPRYMFGTWFGSRAAYPADELQRIVTQFREEEIPLDVLVLDSLSWGAVTWSGYDVDPEQLPDSKGFFAWMKARGVAVTLNEHYGPITPTSDHHFEQVRQALGLPTDTQEIGHDLANQRYAQLFMDVLHKPMLDDGMAFWWQDGNAGSSMPGLDATLWTRHVEYEGQERITGKRTIMFCRLGPVQSYGTPAWGVHRYGGYFTGDLTPYWEVLQLMIPFNVRSGNMLVPYTINNSAAIHQEAVDLEFFQRWVQFSAFEPVIWWHGAWGLRLPWEYGQAGMDTVKQFLTLRYRLLPYIYTYARIAHDTGVPLVRGTYLEYPEQEQAYAFPQQYLFGAELLVAPISRPGGGQPVHQDIYLPAGEHWFDYFTGEIYAGGQVLAYDCPLSRIPLFVKAGAILPMASRMDFANQRPLDPLFLDIYVGKPTTFRLYEDDGDSLAYRQQAYAWTTIHYAPATAQGDHIITITGTDGRYPGQPQARCYCMRVHGLSRPASATAHGRRLPEQPSDGVAEGWVWHPAEQIVEIRLVQPIDIRQTVTVTLVQAGTFEDVVVLRAVRAYRERVRRVKLAVKLRWGHLLANREIDKQPHVLEVVEQVEQQLNDRVAHPAGVATRPPDFHGMTAAILAAFVTQPFDSRRTHPDLDASHAATYADMASKTFTAEWLTRMTTDLLDCRLVASTSGDPYTANFNSGPTFTVQAQIVYDTACMGTPPTVAYELTLPEAGPPWWDEFSRTVQPDGTAQFGVRAPFPTPEGTYWLKLRATLTWGANQTVLERNVPWVVYPPPHGWVPSDQP